MFIGIKRCLACLWKHSRETARHSKTHKSVTFTIDRGNGASDNTKLNKTNSTRFKFKILQRKLFLHTFYFSSLRLHFYALFQYAPLLRWNSRSADRTLRIWILWSWILDDLLKIQPNFQLLKILFYSLNIAKFDIWPPSIRTYEELQKHVS